MAVNGKHVFYVCCILYLFWYACKVAHRPKLHYSRNALTSDIINNCKSFRRRYFPLFLFHSSYFQLFLQAFIGAIYPKLFQPNYHRELFTLSDGQQIALDWTYPLNFNPSTHPLHSRPIVIGMYGISGTNTSLNILRYCKLLASRLGFVSVVLGRRGHEDDIPLTIAKMSVFGLQDDIHECVLHLHRKYPNAPLVLLGDSAGTGFWVRYTGDLALCINDDLYRKHRQNNTDENGVVAEIKHYEHAQSVHDKILCSVLISPGYDIDKVFVNQNWFTKRLILRLMKGTFVNEKHVQVLKDKHGNIVDECSASSCTLQFFRTYSGHLSGYQSYDEFLMQTNPTETAQYAQIPALIINSRDDPICTAESLDEWKWLFQGKETCPNAILMETRFGSHCAFFNVFGGFWLDEVIVDYVKTVYEIRRNRERIASVVNV